MTTVFKTTANPDSALVAAAILGVYSLRLLLDVYDIGPLEPVVVYDAGTLEPVAKGVQFALPADVATDDTNTVRVVRGGPETFNLIAGRVAGLDFIEADRENGLGVSDLHLAIGARVTGRPTREHRHEKY